MTADFSLSVAITSAWVWAAVFLQTGTLTYLYGVSIPWWFGMGGFVGEQCLKHSTFAYQEKSQPLHSCLPKSRPTPVAPRRSFIPS